MSHEGDNGSRDLTGITGANHHLDQRWTQHQLARE